MSLLQIYGVALPEAKICIYLFEHDAEWRARFLEGVGRDITVSELRTVFTELADPEAYVTFDGEAIADQLALALPQLTPCKIPHSTLVCYRGSDSQSIIVGSRLQYLQTTQFGTVLDEKVEYDLTMIPVRLATTVYDLHKIPLFASQVPQIYYVTAGSN
jgi:hypothetical protein